MNVTEETLRILLIEDEPGDARLIRHHLNQGSPAGVTETTDLTHVETLTEGLDQLAENPYDFVLLDLGLPESTGLETLDMVLSHSPELPVVVLTGLEDREMAIEAIKEGAQDYLPKDDLGTDQLLRALRYAIERKEREEKLAHQRDELKSLNRINTVIRGIDQAIVSATTRDEVEQAACDRLAAAGPYRFAVVGELPSDDDPFTPRSWAGIEKRDPETLMDTEDRGREHRSLVEAGQTQAVQVVQGDEDSTLETSEDETSELEFGASAAIPLVFEETVYGVLRVYADRPYVFDERECEVLEELGETIGRAIAAIERREREQILTALHQATRELLQTETKRKISELIVDTATEVLDLNRVGIFDFDEERNILHPVATTPELVEFYGEERTFHSGVDDSLVWDVFVTGETAVVDDFSTNESVVEARTGTDAQSGLFIPLSDHGVFVAVSNTAGVFDTHTRNLVDLIAATTEAALDRVDREAELREHDLRLQEQNRKLTQVNQLNDIIREIDQGLIQAASREGIEQTVCERLTEVDRFSFAWIGERDQSSGGIVPQSWASEPNGYLDDISLTLDDETGEPANETMRTREVTVVSNVASDLRSDPWRQEALSRGYQSAISVPLVYEEVMYGALTVYASQESAFNDLAQAVFKELGETIAYAINTTQRKSGILAREVTELDLRIRAPDCFLTRIASRTGSQVEYNSIVPESDNTSRILFSVRDVPVDGVLDIAGEMISIESISHISDAEDEHLFEATLTNTTIATTLVDYGATPQEIVADDEEIHVLIELPQHTDIRSFVEMLRERFPETEMVACRNHRQPARTRQPPLTELEDEITDRQHEVVQRAYEMGYFADPRKATGQEVADNLGISQPTFNYHCRAVERKLFRVLFGGS